MKETLRREAASKAVEYIEDGMIVGIGAGKTLFYVIDEIARIRGDNKLRNVKCIPTCIETEKYLEAHKIPRASLQQEKKLRVDLAIETADEMDSKMNIIKGKEGCLYLEKFIARLAKCFICIVDESKIVKYLGEIRRSFPIEVEMLTWRDSLRYLKYTKELGKHTAEIRMDENGKEYMTENLNYILDIFMEEKIKNPENVANSIRGKYGIVEHGLFIDCVDICIIGSEKKITIKERIRD